MGKFPLLVTLPHDVLTAATTTTTTTAASKSDFPPSLSQQVADPDEDYEPEPHRQAGGAARHPARGHARGAVRDTWPTARAHAQVLTNKFCKIS